MANDIGVIITGDRKVEIKFDQFPEKLRAALVERIRGLTVTLYARIWANTPFKTGRLRSLLREEVFDDKKKITGRVNVGGDYVRAAALEYGIHSEFEVAGHRMRLDHAWNRRINPTEVFVERYTRHVETLGKRFIRRGTQTESGPIEAALRETVDKTFQADL